MQVAQRLYEGIDIGGETVGLITFMRTDGVQMAPEAVEAARRAIAAQFGDRYLPEKPRFYSTRPRTPRKPTRPSARRFHALTEHGAPLPRFRPAAALRPDLEARHRLADGIGRDGADNGRVRCGNRQSLGPCAGRAARPPAR